MSYHYLLDLALILLSTKLLGIATGKFQMPRVVGALLAGLILGPAALNILSETAFLSQLSELGVIVILFTAGMGTDLRELRSAGKAGFLVALCGVLVPMLMGTGFGWMAGRLGWLPDNTLLENIFLGTVLTATSVSITVESLKEMGKLKSKVGTTILSAAIIDDIIGIIVLTFVIGFKNPESKPITVLINTVLFFVFAIVVGFIFYKIFQFVDSRYPHTRRIPIAGLAFCLAMAYIAERYFGIADITGAYVAGIILCSIRDSEYIAAKMDTNSYMLFGPVFFASIGLKTNVESVTMSILIFSIAFVAVGLISKIVGCGLMAHLCRFNGLDSLKIGVGMMTRGEVALIVAQKGLTAGLLTPVYFTSVIFLIIVSSISTPIILKILYSKDTVSPT